MFDVLTTIFVHNTTKFIQNTAVFFPDTTVYEPFKDIMFEYLRYDRFTLFPFYLFHQNITVVLKSWAENASIQVNTHKFPSWYNYLLLSLLKDNLGLVRSKQETNCFRHVTCWTLMFYFNAPIIRFITSRRLTLVLAG